MVDFITVDQFEAMDLPDTCDWELHNGTVVSLTFPGFDHIRIQKRLYDIFQQSLQNASTGFEVFIELPYRTGVRNDHRADVALITARQAREDVRTGVLQGSPVLVIEVLSRSNLPYRMDELEELCFAHGCEEFWRISTRKLTVEVRNARGRATYTVDDVIPVLVPEFSTEIRVRDIFA